MPQQVDGRHRATGHGRYLTLRTAAPRHLISLTRPHRWPWAVVVAAVLALAATVPLFLHDAGTPQAAVPLPAISIPPPVANPVPAASRRPLNAVAQQRKLSASPSASRSSASPVLLGPADDAGLPQLLSAYCRATVGRRTLALSANGGWMCGRILRDPVPIDMDAACRWRYGSAAWADQIDDTRPAGWRCYRDGP
ncbi:hypothetical protein AB0368_20025 [Actinoplanes sp. NPDC051475]|uniref:hypothetical protein n=1 Tax=Actinoplanes sp. NPDC051475 TaxID=3157225 RepID=UPI00344C06B4